MGQKEYKIRDYMTSKPYTVTENTTVTEARKIMQDLGVRHLPVLEGGKIIGVLSERDVKMAVGLIGATPEAVQVHHLCQENPYTVDEDSPLSEVAATMSKKRVGSTLVLDSNQRLVGIFTTVDACRALAAITASSEQG